MSIATFNNVSVFYHTSAVGMGVQNAHALCHFQCSVIDHTIAIGRGFMRLMFIATFNNVSVIYHTIAIGRGIQEAHVYCHFQ